MRFGLVRFRSKNDAIEVIERTNGRWLCESIVNINIAKFERPFRSNLRDIEEENRKSEKEIKYLKIIKI